MCKTLKYLLFIILPFIDVANSAVLLLVSRVAHSEQRIKLAMLIIGHSRISAIAAKNGISMALRPTIILSLPIRNSNAFNGEQYRCLAAGRDAVLIKPLTQQDLLTLVSEHIGHLRRDVGNPFDGRCAAANHSHLD
ncbi:MULTISPECIES: hypothetical protein [Rahnella]|uniref:hypothetical protein n=1 Tax=Rahnella TaxID=34037 RepID=UPI003F6DAC02